MSEIEPGVASCPVCGSEKYQRLFSDRNRRDGIDCGGTYAVCGKCSHRYLRERPAWGEIVKYYSLTAPDLTANSGKVDAASLLQQAQQPLPGWKKLLRKFSFRPHSWPIEKVTPGTKRLLDLGCGSGGKLIEFAARGYEIWGVDVSPDAIKVCQKILPQGHFIVSELANINLPAGYFDYIRLDNVLEHIPEPRGLLRECQRLLKPDGKLLIYVPHGNSLTVRIFRGNSVSAWIPFHLHLFTRPSLQYLLSQAGFNHFVVYGYYPFSWLPASIMQWKRRKHGRADLTAPTWLSLLCLPVGCLFSKVGLAEELVIVGKKG